MIGATEAYPLPPLLIEMEATPPEVFNTAEPEAWVVGTASEPDTGVLAVAVRSMVADKARIPDPGATPEAAFSTVTAALVPPVAECVSVTETI